MPRKKVRWLLVSAVLVSLLVAGTSQSATAQTATAPQTASTATATYSYYAGHPLNFNGPGAGVCTGSYTISGTSGSFIMTAAHCAAVGTTVYGTSAAFATVAHRKTSPYGDSELLSYYSYVAPYQIIVDPKTGARPGPGGQGRVTGIMPNGAQTQGVAIGKMGITTGWTEGTITGIYTWKGVPAIVTNCSSEGGDSGGPVWRWDGAGLRAVGMHVGSLIDTSTNTRIGGVYIPINTLLQQWGATLPVFSQSLSTSKDIQSDSGQMIQKSATPGTLNLDPALPVLCGDGNCTLVEE